MQVRAIPRCEFDALQYAEKYPKTGEYILANLLFNCYLDTTASFSHNISRMEEPRLTRSHLESLSTDELAAMADSFGIDIPFGLDRLFIVEELLDFTQSGSIAPEENALNRPDFMEAAALPKQYNISYVEVLIRDPLWAFVFWEVKGHDRELYEKTSDFEGYCLRVVPLKENGGTDSRPNGEESFTVQVGVDDTAWYLGFPPAGGWYMVELCVLRQEEKTVLTVSRRFKMPRLLEPPNKKTGLYEDLRELYQNPLVRLSGAHDFALIRSADRLFRTKINSACN